MKYQISEQMGLFEFLDKNYNSMPGTGVKIEGVINTEKAADFAIRSTYRDIFLIINMLDDYVFMLRQSAKENSAYMNYMIMQFERISKELSEQIALDKEKIFKKCQKRNEKQEDVGEEAMILGSRSKGTRI